MNDRTAVAVQNAAQVVERTTHVDVGNIDVPVLMRMRRLLEPRTLARRLSLPSREQSGSLQYPPNAGRTHGHNVRIQHHERQPPITFQRILQMETDDRFFLPRLQPEITGNPTIVFIDAPVALSPVVELAGPARSASGRIARRRSPSSPTSAGRNPPPGPAHRAAPTLWSELPKTFF
jgi:hypothetical protein